jgi:hypothetical protein
MSVETTMTPKGTVAAAVDSPAFSITRAQLGQLHVLGKEEECAAALVALGGTGGVSRALLSDAERGVPASSVAVRAAAFGHNVVPDPPFVSWIALFLESFDDMILRILMLASIISIIIGSIPDLAEGATAEERNDHAKKGWIEGFACVAASGAEPRVELRAPRLIPPA